MKPPHLLIMGVAGTGKTTIAELLSRRLGLTYMDADDFHPQENIWKMESGTPLTDEDRWPWLDAVIDGMQELKEEGFILACSALKASYRTYLQAGIFAPLQIVFLEGDFELIAERIRQRKGHFFDDTLLRSQFDTLEIPTEAFHITIKHSPEEIVASIIKHFSLS